MRDLNRKSRGMSVPNMSDPFAFTLDNSITFGMGCTDKQSLVCPKTMVTILIDINKNDKQICPICRLKRFLKSWFEPTNINAHKVPKVFNKIT